MKKTFFLPGLLFLVATVTVQAQVTFDWTFSYVDSGITNVEAGGTMLVDTNLADDSGAGYLVEQMYGTIFLNSDTITGLYTGGGQISDLANLTGTPDQLGSHGITFLATKAGSGIFFPAGPSDFFDDGLVGAQGVFSAVPAPTPEPSALALAALGSGVLLKFRRRK